jgi:predicted TIM-barrel fold metal-dependent hydrolase
MSDTPEFTAVCDCHIHSFDSKGQTSSGSYVPPPKDLGDYLLEARSCHIARAVVVQASVDGTDNSRLVRTLRSASGIEVRGVATIDADTVVNLDELDAAGIRALRIQDRTRLGRNELALLPDVSRRAATMDWHVELNTEPERFDALAEQIQGLPEGQFLVLDHMGHVDPRQAGDLIELCRLLDTGRVWAKLSPTRVSHRDDYRDLAETVSRLASAYPDRCIWGSDWPHVMTEPPLPEIRTMLSFFADVLTGRQFRACMWANPAKLYRF